MKHIISILLCMILLFSLTACELPFLPEPDEPGTHTTAETTAAPTQPSAAPTETTVPTETEVPQETFPVSAYQLPLTSISTPQMWEREYTKDYQMIFAYNYPNITFTHQDAEVSRMVLLDLRNRLDSTRREADILKANALRVYEDTGVAPEYHLNVICQSMRLDQSILSLLINQSAFSGEGQNKTASQAVTYDLITGNALTLSQLLAEDADSDQLCRILVDALSGTEGLFSGYEYTVEDLFAGNALPENWYLDTRGLCFYFAPYEIAPYAMGTVTATLPYDTLNGVIKDRYYPAETPEATGSMEVIPFEEADLTKFSAFAELILDDTDGAYLFYPTDTVTELRIEQVSYDTDAGGFVAYNTAFAADVMTAGQAVRAQYIFPGLFPSVRVSYTSGGQRHTYYLYCSGEDGSVYLAS